MKRFLRKRFRSASVFTIKFASNSPKLSYIEFTLNKSYLRNFGINLWLKGLVGSLPIFNQISILSKRILFF
ncbi:hypothetical protein LEP1GSC103_0521 [Leptospira borgpetersenii serovar Javanica str. UI 09931]|uniref:Uncharacterized protein n=3 Tax=Leptospira borgpetersenii TaxID=174 RepID=M3FFA7_LEPBO|nr:hypothetical protein C4Q31_06215 [Leptospira borgpetersenii serovar Ceylonica]EKP14437.1 hypothetical protein LEP1GSC128_1423 [Leptospira borgpetersenii str. 200801926]EKQ92463.1 hypothetical protein LEP1GSC101_2929 [Leptospira borgpetersenii str. UI 09149]EMG00533.1 hypothetical protein LEP1GSC123_2803 [Leptospira borgpetersenii str. 200701203]EMK12427.1 hypothetical protein LEP1GSC066_3178 [Leptospira sp. serovar Kenya str. Sh9]EMN13402.1 hypothetical protein LEP1GSC055_1001 [Leptospira b